jgi:pantetheine-phosphate adenylyltransferase
MAETDALPILKILSACASPRPPPSNVVVTMKKVPVPVDRKASPTLSGNRRSVTAVYPGSFDPITNGHLDLIERGSRLFDRLIVAILENAAKEPLFSVEERMEMLREVTRPYPNVSVDSFHGLLVDYMKERSAQVILRGIRAISDYEYELQMALMNNRLWPGVETVFLMSSEAYSFVSSRLIKQVFELGGDVSGLVPPIVEARLKNRVRRGA